MTTHSYVQYSSSLNVRREPIVCVQYYLYLVGERIVFLSTCPLAGLIFALLARVLSKEPYGIILRHLWRLPEALHYLILRTKGEGLLYAFYSRSYDFEKERGTPCRNNCLISVGVRKTRNRRKGSTKCNAENVFASPKTG